MQAIENHILGRKVDMKMLATYRKEKFANSYYHVLCLPCDIPKSYYIPCSQQIVAKFNKVVFNLLSF